MMNRHSLFLTQNTDAKIQISRLIDDLEQLLNTRNNGQYSSKNDPISHSIVNYGIEDFSSLNPELPQQRSQLCATIKCAISRFLPQLSHVTVKSQRVNTAMELTFTIYAKLKTNYEQINLRFNSIFSSVKNQFSVIEVSEDE